MAFDIKLTSFIDDINKDIEDAAVKGLTTGAIRIHGEVVRNLEGSVVTGRLRASQTYAVDGSQPRGHEKVAESKPNDSKLSANDMEAIIGTNVEYAAKAERVSRTPGYMRNAYDENKKKVQGDIEKAIKKAVKR